MPTRLLRTSVGIASIIVILALVASALGCSSSTPSEAQDFTLPDLTGATITLSDLAGTPVVITFWATWCSYCTPELPYFEEVAQRRAAEIEVIAINVGENNATILNFFNGYEPTMTVALDRNGAIFVSYCQNYANSRGYIPFTLLVDSKGLVRQVRIGSFGSETELWNALHDVLGITVP